MIVDLPIVEKGKHAPAGLQHDLSHSCMLCGELGNGSEAVLRKNESFNPQSSLFPRLTSLDDKVIDSLFSDVQLICFLLQNGYEQKWTEPRPLATFSALCTPKVPSRSVSGRPSATKCNSPRFLIKLSPVNSLVTVFLNFVDAFPSKLTSCSKPHECKRTTTQAGRQEAFKLYVTHVPQSTLYLAGQVDTGL